MRAFVLVVFLREAYSHVADTSSPEGLDINSTTPPSQYQMFKLVTNRKFVRAVKRVMEELNAAGLKLNSDVCTSLLACSYPSPDYCSFRMRCRRLWD